MTVTVVGGGLAGAEAAWALAERGIDVELHEMRPAVPTPAHQTGRLAELVCSNSFKSTDLSNAHGLLKDELRRLGSFLLPIADEARVPAGAALAVDREVFSRVAHERLAAHPRIRLVTGEVTTLPSPGIIATGPLTSEALAHAILHALSAPIEHVRSGRMSPAATDAGGEGSAVASAVEAPAQALAFYDAIAPIVSRESIDESVVYALSRYGKGDGDDYLNCPMTREEYDAFLAALTSADQFTAHAFDQVPYFEGCLPVEEMARRGPETLRFGPMKPVGLRDPRTGRDPHAVVQLRREDRAGQMWNLVGFQTRLRIPEQQRVFRLIPGLANAEFLRFGSIHRNSYLNSPAYLGPALTAPGDPALFFAGQLTGVEGYTESLGTGLLAGINLARVLRGREPAVPPPTTMLGALYRHLREADPRHFQPMNANFGLVEPIELPKKTPKDRKKELLVERARADFGAWLATLA